MAISKRWPTPEQQYRQWYKSKAGFDLGQVQFVQVEPDTWVANMIGQNNICGGGRQKDAYLVWHRFIQAAENHLEIVLPTFGL